MSAAPRTIFRRLSTVSPFPRALSTKTPLNAAGTDPIESHFTSGQLTVPRLMWTPPPTGFITTAATRSLETAASGCTLNSRTRMGVINAPPPIPVSPTVNPTIKPATAIQRSTCIWSLPSSDREHLDYVHQHDREAGNDMSTGKPAVPPPLAGDQRAAQASGSLAISLMWAGSDPEARSATVTCSRTARRLARTAIHTSRSDSAGPV